MRRLEADLQRSCTSHKTVENSSREELYAAKEFRRWPDEAEETHSRLMVAEFCIARELRHPNVVQVLDLLKDESENFHEILEFCPGVTRLRLCAHPGSWRCKKPIVSSNN